MPLYNRLKDYRNKLGINQTDLGHLCGVSRQTISDRARGLFSICYFSSKTSKGTASYS